MLNMVIISFFIDIGAIFEVGFNAHFSLSFESFFEHILISPLVIYQSLYSLFVLLNKSWIDNEHHISWNQNELLKIIQNEKTSNKSLNQYRFQKN